MGVSFVSTLLHLLQRSLHDKLTRLRTSAYTFKIVQFSYSHFDQFCECFLVPSLTLTYCVRSPLTIVSMETSSTAGAVQSFFMSYDDNAEAAAYYCPLDSVVWSWTSINLSVDATGVPLQLPSCTFPSITPFLARSMKFFAYKRGPRLQVSPSRGKIYSISLIIVMICVFTVAHQNHSITFMASASSCIKSHPFLSEASSLLSRFFLRVAGLTLVQTVCFLKCGKFTKVPLSIDF